MRIPQFQCVMIHRNVVKLLWKFPKKEPWNFEVFSYSLQSALHKYINRLSGLTDSLASRPDNARNRKNKEGGQLYTRRLCSSEMQRNPPKIRNASLINLEQNTIRTLLVQNTTKFSPKAALSYGTTSEDSINPLLQNATILTSCIMFWREFKTIAEHVCRLNLAKDMLIRIIGCFWQLWQNSKVDGGNQHDILRLHGDEGTIQL